MTSLQSAVTAGTPDAETIWRPTYPVSPQLVLSPLQRGSGDPTQRTTPDGALWRTAHTPDGPATLRLLTVSGDVYAQGWGPGAGWLVERVPTMLGADDDVGDFAPVHPLITRTWRRLAHHRLPSTRLVFEMLVPAILEQRVTGAEARRSWAELLRRFGTVAPGPAPAGMRVCPPAGRWQRIPSWDWHRAGVDPGRARTVIAAAEVAHRLEECLALPRRDRVRRLRSVPGVGIWTAAETAQRAWGDPDEPSVGDFHIHDLVGWALLGRPISDDQMLDVLAAYPGHRHRAVRMVELSGARKPAFGPRAPIGDIRGW